MITTLCFTLMALGIGMLIGYFWALREAFVYDEDRDLIQESVDNFRKGYTQGYEDGRGDREFLLKPDYPHEHV